MSAARIDSREALGTAWGGPGGAGAVPARTSPAPADQVRETAYGGSSASQSGWGRTVLRVLRNAAIGLALLSTIPFGLVASRSVVFVPEMSHLVRRTAEAADWRDFRAPIDASITPQAAGMALRRITTPPSREHYIMRSVTSTHARPWSSITLAPDLFPGMRTPQSKSPAASMLISKTPGGYSAGEMAYLREVAEAPFWKDFDAVSLASQVDMIGGLYETPFTAEAELPGFPTVGYTDAKQTAYAGVARATYYLASGNPAEAERVLRTIMSFGFTFIDQGVTTLDAMVGRMIVGIGRDGLYHLYLQTGRGELAERVSPPSANAMPVTRSRAAPVDQKTAHALALALISDVRAPRPIRIGALEALSYGGSCGSVRTMLTGPSDELRNALAAARQSMARYPSEQAYFDLVERTMNNGPPVERDASLIGRVASGTASVLSAVTGNPRIASCTNLATVMKSN